MRDAEHVTTRDGRLLCVERGGARNRGARDRGDRPVVVLESGMGVSRHMWGATIERLDGRVATVAYDRSGLGDSPPDPAPRTLDRLASDLVDVLGDLGDAPVVLVGHSWGGPIVRRAAEQVPDRVAGLVLVDVTEETCELFVGAAGERQTRLALPLLPLLARTGVTRLAVRSLASKLPDAAAAGMRAVDGTVAAARTQQAELRHHVDDLRGLLAAPPALPRVPITYISGTRAARSERGRRPAVVAAHAAAADGLPLGRHVTADRSGHHVPVTEPDLVADEILRVVDAAAPTG